jgi:hypothetical protein
MTRPVNWVSQRFCKPGALNFTTNRQPLLFKEGLVPVPEITNHL